MIIFLHGADTFRSREYLRGSIQKFKRERDPQGYNVVILDGVKSDAGRVIAEISSAPFLAERRLIVIEDVLASGDKEFLEELTRRVVEKRIPDSNIVIFWQGEKIGKIKEAKKLYELLQKEKFAQEFAPFDRPKTIAWIEKVIKDRSGTIDSSAREYLAANLGHDMWLLNSTLEQLLAYASGRAISMDDVWLFVEEHVDQNAFAMVEAVVSGNHKLALKLLASERRHGEEDQKIFGLLIWQFRTLLTIADLIDKKGEMPSDSIATELSLHPFVVKKNIAVVKKYPLAVLEKLYEKLLDIDVKVKTGVAPQPLLIDIFAASV